MIDLEQLAEANAPHIEAEFQHLLHSRSLRERVVLIEYSEWVRDVCKLTINVKLYAVFDLINKGRYLNMHEAIAEYTALLGVPPDELLKAWLGTHYRRRMAFDMAFDMAFKDGHKFVYAALTGGDGGLREYDPYCIQLTDAFHSGVNTLIYLPGDSLTICFKANGDFDEPRTCAMITSRVQRHMLASNRNWAAVLACARLDWPGLMSTKANYIEAVLIGDVTLSEIAKVQILRSEYDRMIRTYLKIAAVSRLAITEK